MSKGSGVRGSLSGRDAAGSGYVYISSDSYVQSSQNQSFGQQSESSHGLDSFPGLWEFPLSPMETSSYSVGMENHFPSQNAVPPVQSPVPPAAPAAPPVGQVPANGPTNQAGQNGPQGMDPTLNMVHNLLSQVLQNRLTPSSGSESAMAPDFLKIVTTMKTLGTYRFGGSTDLYVADAWLQNIEKNLAATRCPEEFKKDVGIYYLEKDARIWWSTIERQHGYPFTSWEGFKGEFIGKYFPHEARNRLEEKFYALQQ